MSTTIAKTETGVVSLISEDRDFSNRIACQLIADQVAVDAFESVDSAVAAIEHRDIMVMLVDDTSCRPDAMSVIGPVCKNQGVPLARISRNGRGVTGISSEESGHLSLLTPITEALSRPTWSRAIVAGLHFDLNTLILSTEHGHILNVPRREAEIIRLLLVTHGRPVSTRQIFAALWSQAFGDIASVAVHICRLRHRFLDLVGDSVIQTIRRKGYFIPAALVELEDEEPGLL